MTGTGPFHELLVRLGAGGSVALLDAALAEEDPSPRRPDGRRSSALTPAGHPFEASLSVGRDPDPGAAGVRWSATPGTRHRFFAERLAATRRAWSAVGALVEGPQAGAWEAAGELLDVTFPDATRVRARTGLVAAIGVATSPAGCGLRLYVHAGADPAAAGRLLGHGGLPGRGLFCRGPGPMSGAPGLDLAGQLHLAAVDVAPDGRISRRSYFGVPSVAALPEVAAPLRPALAAAGLPVAVLDHPAIVATDGRASTVHLSTRTWAAAGVDIAVAVLGLATLLPAGAAVVDRWDEAAATGAVRWGWTITGLCADDDGLVKLNAYLAPC